MIAYPSSPGCFEWPPHCLHSKLPPLCSPKGADNVYTRATKTSKKKKEKKKTSVNLFQTARRPTYCYTIKQDYATVHSFGLVGATGRVTWAVTNGFSFRLYESFAPSLFCLREGLFTLPARRDGNRPSAIVSPGTPRDDVWGGRGTGARSLGAGWRSVERAVRNGH